MTAQTPTNMIPLQRFSRRNLLWSKRSTRLHTAYAVLDSYSRLSVAALLEPLDANYTHQLLPSPLDTAIHQRTAFAAHAQTLVSAFTSFAVVPKEVFEDPSQNVVIAHCDVVGDLAGLGTWRSECVVMLWMSDDETRVVAQQEFVDSAKARELREWIMNRKGGVDGDGGAGDESGS